MTFPNVYSSFIKNELAPDLTFPVSDQFFYLGSNRSGIATVPTNPFPVSPFLDTFGVYQFQYWLGLSNSSTGTITVGWASASVTQIIAEVNVLPAANGTAYAGVNPFNSTANKAITGGATAATHWIRISGFVTNNSSAKTLPINVSVSSGAITPLAGSNLRFFYAGQSSSGTSNISVGDIQ